MNMVIRSSKRWKYRCYPVNGDGAPRDMTLMLVDGSRIMQCRCDADMMDVLGFYFCIHGSIYFQIRK